MKHNIKKIILTIVTATVFVFAMAQEATSLPTFVFTGSSPSSPYILEIKFYDQFAGQVFKENVEFPNWDVLDYCKNQVPFQIANINMLSYINDEWVIAEHLFHYEPTRKVKNGGQLSEEYASIDHNSYGTYSVVNPRDYDKTWLLLKKYIIVSGYFTINGNVDLYKQIDCEFIVDVPFPGVITTSTFTGFLSKIDNN